MSTLEVKAIQAPTGFTLAMPDSAKNTPAFGVIHTGTAAVSDNVQTKVTFNTVEFNDGSAWDTTNNRFIVPSGEAGDYFFMFTGTARDTSNAMSGFYMEFRKNGSTTEHQTNSLPSYIGGNARNWSANSVFFDTLAVGDYIEFFIKINGNSDSSTMVERPRFTGFKLIT